MWTWNIQYMIWTCQAYRIVLVKGAFKFLIASGHQKTPKDCMAFGLYRGTVKQAATWRFHLGVQYNLPS